MKRSLLAFVLTVSLMDGAKAAHSAVSATNTIGLELLGRAGKSGENTAISPFSIQMALVMTYAGAEGETRKQMTEVLHLGPDAVESFAALQKQITSAPESVTFTLANRLFGQKGYDFRKDYLALVKDEFGAPLEPLDFRANPQKATDYINAWVEKKTRDRIRNLIPEKGLSPDSRLVLVNAIYLKAPWAEPFNKAVTVSRPFHFPDKEYAGVDTMLREDEYGYRKDKGFTVVSIPYAWSDLEFVVLLPDKVDGLPALEKKLSAVDLEGFAKLPRQRVRLYLPKFKLEPPRFALGETLQKMGMPSAFNKPEGSANFAGIAPRLPNDYLFISEVFHKAFVEIDEEGTEAAAATAVVMVAGSAMPTKRPEPVEVRVDRPFLFAIQHRPTGACIFLGRVTDPQ